MLRVDLTALAVNGPVQKVAGVKLQARLGGEHFHNAARLRISGLGCNCREPRMIQYKVLVIALGEDKLLVVGIDSLADHVRLREVERRSFNTAEFAGGNQTFVNRSIPVGVDRKFISQNVTLAFAG